MATTYKKVGIKVTPEKLKEILIKYYKLEKANMSIEIVDGKFKGIKIETDFE